MPAQFLAPLSALAGARQGAQGRGELRGRAKAARRRPRAASGSPVGAPGER
ncbi:hypothetical protein ACH4S8_19395 [Streptomyces sp. NPDC021080]|uniref:hypothetical protein n=1 Tax=Streptomyces sp. NPDC021080 TaxID=3365110 RepID=UPI00379A1A71